MRALLVLLMLANLGFLSWTLSPYAQAERDPTRAAREVHPQAVTLIPVLALAPGTGSTICLESGPYQASEIGLVEVAVSSVALPGSWARVSAARAGQWAVYLGPFADKESLARKEQEVIRTSVPFELITERGPLDLGFLLGRFADPGAATAALESLSRKAPLRNARVVSLAPSQAGFMLRIASANANIEKRLRSIKVGVIKPFEVCVQ